MMRDLSSVMPGVRSLAAPFGPSTTPTDSTDESFVWQGRFRFDRYFANTWKLYRWLQRIHPELVVLHGFIPMVFLSLPAKKAGVATIVGIDVGPQPTYRLAKKMLFWFSRHALTQVASVSQGSAEWFANAYPWLRNRVKTIVIGVDMPASGPQRNRLQKPPYVITTISRMDAPQKDPVTLVRAAALLVERKLPVRIQLIGDGNLLPALNKLTSALGVKEHVYFLGHRSDLQAILDGSDIFVLATNWEGLSLSMLMAMASDLPVVASKVVGVADVISDGQTGRLFRNGDYGQLAVIIEDLIKNPSQAKTMGILAAADASEKYRRSRMIDEYHQWFVELLEEKSTLDR